MGAIDPNHLFFLEGILLFTLNTSIRPIQARNLVYADHVYEGSLVPPFWTGDPRPLADRFAQREREARALNAPWWVGEFGHDPGPILVGWSSLTLGSPLVSASCMQGRAWDASTARLTIMVKPDTACRLDVSA